MTINDLVQIGLYNKMAKYVNVFKFKVKDYENVSQWKNSIMKH